MVHRLTCECCHFHEDNGKPTGAVRGHNDGEPASDHVLPATERGSHGLRRRLLDGTQHLEVAGPDEEQ